ncbi:MAG: hypothetical protein VW714_08305 [Rhodospirillales bacterium]
MSGEIWAREALYVGEHVSQWMGPDNRPWRWRWGLFVPAKKDGTPDNRFTPRASKQHLLERGDNVARLYDGNVLQLELRDCPPGSWDVEEVWSL